MLAPVQVLSGDDAGRPEGERLQGGAAGAGQRLEDGEEGGDQRPTGIAGLLQSAFQVLGGGWSAQTRGEVRSRVPLETWFGSRGPLETGF
jgi:hypothetical protein